MKIIDEKEFKFCQQLYRDAYGLKVLEFSEKWADLMEEEVEKGVSIEECAVKTSSLASPKWFDFINEAKTILIHSWIYGDSLNLWNCKRRYRILSGDR